MLIREANEADYGYIFDTYLNDWRRNSSAGTIRNNRYYEVQRITLEDLIARGAVLKVACPEAYPKVIQGWVCYELKGEEPILHYLYQRPGYQTHARLLDELPGTKPGFYTHRLPLKELRKWKLAPEIARRERL